MHAIKHVRMHEGEFNIIQFHQCAMMFSFREGACESKALHRADLPGSSSQVPSRTQEPTGRWSSAPWVRRSRGDWFHFLDGSHKNVLAVNLWPRFHWDYLDRTPPFWEQGLQGSPSLTVLHPAHSTRLLLTCWSVLHSHLSAALSVLQSL